MEPIRVLHVVTYMGRGGLETMLMNYYRHIDRNKVQFDFLVHRDFIADYDQEIEGMGGKIYRLPRLNPFSKTYLRKLNVFFKEHGDYVIVHSHLDCMAGIPLKYAKKNGIRIRIAHAHNSNQTKDKKYVLKLLIKKNIPSYANQLFACSVAAGKWMFGKKNFDVLNNAIDTQKFRYNKETAMQTRRAWKISEDTLVIGHVGRFMAPKNHAFIIEIFAELLKHGIDTVLVLVGDGELRGDIEKKAEDYGIWEKVIFTGTRSDIPEVLQMMDVFLFPSLYEGLPLSLIEAQASGLPCLISDKVPLECRKTELIYQMNLSDKAEEWAQTIIKISKIQRSDMLGKIREGGFDVQENAKWLENYYVNQYWQVTEKWRK